MEARNYAPNATHNMILPADAQIVAGVIGNGVYLPAGCGTVEMSGTLDAMGVSIWRMWDGVTETEGVRGIFSFKNFGAYFDNVSGKLCVTIPGGTVVYTDVDDDTELNHWVFNFCKNGKVSVYKNAVKVHEAHTAEGAVDLTAGFTLGGGRTHATFDEVYVHTELLKEEEIRGLYCLISSGMPQQQIQEIAQSATAKYLGVTETVPDNRGVLIVKGEHLGTVYANTGDWVLMSKTVGGWKTGVCYRWSGVMWINLEPEYNYEAQYQACLSHIFEIPELTQNMSHYGALFAKMLVTQKALIDSLVVKQLKIDADLSTDNNFEAYFDETHGLEIINEKKTILRVPPRGDSVFTGKVNVGAVQLLDSGVFIKDGEISIENKGWKGSLRPCENGVEFAIMSEEGSAMTKQQMRTAIKNGVLSLFVLGSISCENIYKNNSVGGTWKSDFIFRQGIESIAYGNNLWIACSDTGTFFHSNDFITWQDKCNVPDVDWPASIAYGNNLWVALGGRGGLFTSSDGTTWNNLSFNDNTRAFYSAVYGLNRWVVCGFRGDIITSPDGITWTQSNSSTTNALRMVAYGNGLWVAVGENGTVITSSDGITWAQSNSSTTNALNRVAYGNGLWVAVGDNGTVITSSDGITWAQSNSIPIPAGYVVYGNNIWASLAYGSQTLYTSYDGTTWLSKPLTVNNYSFNFLAYINDRWIISTGNRVFYSADQTVTWVSQ